MDVQEPEFRQHQGLILSNLLDQKMVLGHNIYTFHQDIWKKPDPWKNKCLLRSKFLQSELV